MSDSSASRAGSPSRPASPRATSSQSAADADGRRPHLAQGRLEEGLRRLVHREYDVGEPRRDAEVHLAPPLDDSPERR